MSYSKSEMIITVGARGSKLSRAQVAEVERAVQRSAPGISFAPLWIETAGDKNLNVSLRDLEKSDLFTREIEELQLQGKFRLSIHSLKDLPEKLRPGLEVIAITEGVDSSDVLVHNLEPIPLHGRIGTSSRRREEMIRQFRSDLEAVDIRGDIEARLKLLDEGKVEGVVMAEAALIRLGLTHRKRLRLLGEVAPGQGKLAIVGCEGDEEMRELFY